MTNYKISKPKLKKLKKIVLPVMAVKQLIAVIGYMYEDELRHFEEEKASGYSTRNHIWNSVCGLENVLLKHGLSAVPK